MATLAPSTLNTDQRLLTSRAALAPVAADNGTQALSTAKRFAIGTAGDGFVCSSTADFHMIAGDSSVTATTSHPRFPAGTYKFLLPDGCTHVSMLDTSAGAGNGQAYAG